MKSFSDQFSVTQGETSVNVKEEKVHVEGGGREGGMVSAKKKR